MLRITVNRSSAGAKKYYTEKYYNEGHDLQNYYSEKGQSIGIWGGQTALKLGLKGEINKDDFGALCDNLVPGTTERLTARSNINNRVGYDFTLNASKSVTLACVFGTEKDREDILQAFQSSTKEVMLQIEMGAQTRVRKNGQNDNRKTSNIAYSEHIHFTSRPVEGISDPNLHSHNFIFNATYDHTEKKIKAIELGQVIKDAPYYEAVFHASLADKLKGLGYSIEKTKTGFEIAGISRDTIEKFSRRTIEIEKLAREKNITNKEDKAALGQKTRESKRKSISETDQEKDWNNRLTKEEKEIFKNLRNSGSLETKEKESLAVAYAALSHSIEHHLERKSVATDKAILTTAIKSSIGQTTVKHIETAFAENKSLIKLKENGQTLVTTKEALREENELIAKAQATKGTFKPINEHYEPKTAKLNKEQKAAIQYALNTSDGISIIIGKAGVGKTTLMKEVQNGIKEVDRNIFAFAPSAEASRGVQRKEGFENAETVATLIHDKSLQEKTKNGIIWIDEAPMMSIKDMNKVFDIAKKQNARLILTGDTKQHSSVERGDALRIIIKEAGINSIQVSKIQRQKKFSYKEAVSFLSKSDTDKGFKKLDKMGAIREIANADERVKTISEDYINSIYGENDKKPKEVLVISPTHAEGNKVTEKIREGLKQRELLSKEEKQFTTFKNIQLTAAEKQKSENYQLGNWIVFHQNSKGFKAGSKFEITAKAANGAILIKDNNGKVKALPLDKSGCYHVFETFKTPVAIKEKIRITGNGKSMEGKNLFNGSVFNVKGYDKDNNIKLSNGSTLSKDYGHFKLGYVLTSHASQGKTVDKVIISQSSMSFKASSKEQFYVSVSRGRQAVAIYTDDKADLLRAVSQSGERKSAIELTRQKQILSKMIEINRIKFSHIIRQRALDIIQKVKPVKDINHGLQRSTITKETGRSR